MPIYEKIKQIKSQLNVVSLKEHVLTVNPIVNY